MDLVASGDARADADSWPRVILLAGTLISGLMLGVPLFSALVRFVGVPIPLPLLVGVGLVGLVFAAVVAREGAWLLGGVVALVVLATFNADVPLIAAAHRYPKDVVGRLLLVQLPLAYLCVVAFAAGWHRDSATLPVYLLGGFVAAAALAALLGVRPRLVPTGFFVLYAAELALVAWLVETAIARGVITTRQIAAVFLLAILGHSLVGLAQVVNQGPFGLTYLGEGGANNRVWLVLPALGGISIGPYVAGFTGMSFTLAVFCAAALPLAVGEVVERSGWRRAALVAGVLLLVVVVRFSTADSARGALVLTLLAYGALVTYLVRRRTVTPRPSRRTAVGVACLLVVVMSVVALPSMASDTSLSLSGDDPVESDAPSPPTDSVPDGRMDVGNATTDATATATATPATTTPATTTERTRTMEEADGGIENVSIPLFSTANLGVRLSQYVVALDVFAAQPLFGVGGMNFVHVAGEYDRPVPDGYTYPRPIHNTYLALLTETGLLGFALYVGAMAVVGFYGWRLLHDRSADAYLVAGILAGLIGIAAYAFWNPQLYNAKVTFVFWILAATVSGEYRNRRTRRA